MLRKRCGTAQCAAVHLDSRSTPLGTTYENIISLDCTAVHITVTMSRAQGSLQRVYICAYRVCDKQLDFMHYREKCCIRDGSVEPLQT